MKNLFTIVLLCACAYGIVKWHASASQDNEATRFAENSCVSEIGDRFNAKNIRPYKVNETNNGYVVKASLTLASGKSAKAVCLTNTHGGVRDISIKEF